MGGTTLSLCRWCGDTRHSLVEEIELSGRDAASELRERFDPRQYRLDVRHARRYSERLWAFDRERKVAGCYCC